MSAATTGAGRSSATPAGTGVGTGVGWDGAGMDSDSLSALRLRVECAPYAPDSRRPIRLVLADGEGNDLTALRFTPARAEDAAGSIAGLLMRFIPAEESQRIAEGLKSAAIRVWATRN